MISGRRGSLAFPDFLANGVGALFVKVVYDDICPKSTIHEGIGTAKTRTSSGDDDSLAIKSNGWRRLRVRRQSGNNIDLSIP